MTKGLVIEESLQIMYNINCTFQSYNISIFIRSLRHIDNITNPLAIYLTFSNHSHEFALKYNIYYIHMALRALHHQCPNNRKKEIKTHLRF